MELKPGYKQTEVGVIPEDWDTVPVGRLLEFKNGLNKAKEYFGYGTPIINYMDVYQNSGLTEKDVNGKVNVTSEEIRTYSAKKGDVFFTRTSETVDEIGISTVLLEDIQDAVFSGFVLRGRPISSMLDLQFKKYCFNSVVVRKQIKSTSSYTTRALTNGKSLSKIYLPLPPTKAEQNSIANALSDADALIQSLTRLIAKKRQIKHGAMQTLLNPYENGRWKEGWVVKKLGDSCEMFSGGTPNTAIASYYGGDIQWITSGDLNKGKITEVEGRITKVGLINSSAKTISQDTLLLALYGATSGVVAISKINAAINQAVLAIIPDGSLKSVFLFYILTYLKDWIIATYTQGGQPNLSGNIIKSLELYCPDIDEQTRIATILSDMDTEIAALEAKLAKYRQIKQGMMQNLLTGKIRLI